MIVTLWSIGHSFRKFQTSIASGILGGKRRNAALSRAAVEKAGKTDKESMIDALEGDGIVRCDDVRLGRWRKRLERRSDRCRV
jgi:hypothetical protein